MTRFNEIKDYLLTQGYEEKLFNKDYQSSVSLSVMIAQYAHRNQKRENGEPYFNHSYRCMDHYREWINLNPVDYFSISSDLLYEYGIPYDGVQEVCLLHDVIEDTDFSVKDVEEIFEECHLKEHFCRYIKDALIRITHDKKMEYLEYIRICAENSVSAICKMMDLQDNINLTTLTKLDKKSIGRTHDYIEYYCILDKIWNFTSSIQKYKIEMAKRNKK